MFTILTKNLNLSVRNKVKYTLLSYRLITIYQGKMMSTSFSYRDAGVDIDAGDQLVENIKPFAKRTMRPEVLGDLGGFGALVEI